MNFQQFPFLAFVLLLPVSVFVAIMCAVAKLGGWSALAAEYRCHGTFEGKRWRWQDIVFRGWVGYSGGITIGANAEGMYLGLFFRLAHPPLFIPWAELRASHHDFRILGQSFGSVEFTTTRVPGVRFKLKDRLMAKIAAEVGPLLAEAMQGSS